MSEAVAASWDAQRMPGEWARRPWLLAGLLGLAGLLIHLLTHGQIEVAGRSAAAAFFLFGALAAAFTVDRERWRDPVIFALIAGAVMAGLAWRAVASGDRY